MRGKVAMLTVIMRKIRRTATTRVGEITFFGG